MKTKIKLSKDTVLTVLTGAGISAESGLKTFRDANGLWENHRVEDVASPIAFKNNPEFVWKFYKLRYEQSKTVKPNSAHFGLQKLESVLQSNFTLITQNVDGLHSLAGNKNIIEMHGSLHTCYCTHCYKKYPMEEIDLSLSVPVCKNCNHDLRPDIVWFGELPYHLEKIDQILQKTDVFLVIGTSGMVYPAAQFLSVAKYFGAFCAGINLEPPMNVSLFDEFYRGKAGIILPELIEAWL